jgi:cyclic dehypoxanthinyl futalosine synthase
MITQRQALEFFESDDLIALGMAADQIRKELHPEGLVSYCMEPPEAGAQVVEFGAQEPIEQIVSRLETIRKDGGPLAVMPRSEGTGVEHLKIVALTRIYLDKVPHIQASWQSGLKVGQVALRFGANDISGAEAGSFRATEEDIRRIIRDAGFVPKRRDALFRTYYLD